MADKEIEIQFTTAADTGGAEDVERALQDVNRSEFSTLDKSLDDQRDALSDTATAAHNQRDALKEIDQVRLDHANDEISRQKSASSGGEMAAKKQAAALKDVASSGHAAGRGVDDLAAANKGLAAVTDRARAMKDELKAIERVAESAERQLDDIKLPSGDLLGGLDADKLKEIESVLDGLGLGKHVDAVKGLVLTLTPLKSLLGGISGAAAPLAAVIAVVGSAAWAIKEFNQTIEDYDRIKQLAAQTDFDLGGDLEGQVESLRAMMSIFEPIEQAWAKIKSLGISTWEAVTDPAGLGKLEESLQRAANMQDALSRARLENARETSRDLVDSYNAELDVLEDQERVQSRISSTRRTMAGLAVDKARTEVRAAKVSGGDVDLAEVNLQAAQINRDLGGLTDELADVELHMKAAYKEHQKNEGVYQKLVRDLEQGGLKEKEIEELQKSIEPARKAMQESGLTLVRVMELSDDQDKIIQEKKANILDAAKVSLAELEARLKEGVSQNARLALEDLRASVQEQMSGEARSILDNIAPDLKPLETAVAEKKSHMDQAITETKNVVTGSVDDLGKGVQDLGLAAKESSAQMKQPLAQAEKNVVAAINSQGAIVISAMQSVHGAITTLNRKLQIQKSQIDALAARIR